MFEGLRRESFRRNLELLSRLNHVGVFQDVRIRFENDHVGICVTIFFFGDFPIFDSVSPALTS